MALKFPAKARKIGSKGEINALRSSGEVPAILYGMGNNYPLSVNYTQLFKEMSKGGIKSKLLELDVDGKKFHSVLKDVQLHPVKDTLQHIDFQEVDINLEMKFPVKVKFINTDKCIGVKRGGLLNIIKNSIEVICKPGDIPHFIEVDTSALDIGASVHLGTLDLPAGVSAHGDPKFTIASLIGRSTSDDGTTTEQK